MDVPGLMYLENRSEENHESTRIDTNRHESTRIDTNRHEYSYLRSNIFDTFKVKLYSFLDEF